MFGILSTTWDKTWPKKYCVKEFCCRLRDSIVGPFSTSMLSGNNLRRLVRVLRHRSDFCSLCPNSELRAREFEIPRAPARLPDFQ